MAQSPFVDEGLVCSSCVFYDGARACEIVEGDIAPEGICKKWIIPDRLIAADTVAPDMESDETSEIAVRYGALEIQHRKVQGRDVEFRTVSVGNIEVRSDMEGQPMRFRGYAAVFNSPSEPLPFTETIRPGAFKRSLNAGREVRMFVNHNTDLVLGSTRSGTITVTEDQRGLLVEGELPDTTYARDLSALMQRGDVHGMSFGFSVPRGGDVWSENGAQRMLTEVILHEVSVVTGFPAYPETTGATVRNTETETHIDETPVGTVPVSVARRMSDLYAKKA
jgi:HK97 family phage prohead protease